MMHSGYQSGHICFSGSHSYFESQHNSPIFKVSTRIALSNSGGKIIGTATQSGQKSSFLPAPSLRFAKEFWVVSHKMDYRPFFIGIKHFIQDAVTKILCSFCFPWIKEK